MKDFFKGKKLILYFMIVTFLICIGLSDHLSKPKTMMIETNGQKIWTTVLRDDEEYRIAETRNDEGTVYRAILDKTLEILTSYSLEQYEESTFIRDDDVILETQINFQEGFSIDLRENRLRGWNLVVDSMLNQEFWVND